MAHTFILGRKKMKSNVTFLMIGLFIFCFCLFSGCGNKDEEISCESICEAILKQVWTIDKKIDRIVLKYSIPVDIRDVFAFLCEKEENVIYEGIALFDGSKIVKLNLIDYQNGDVVTHHYYSDSVMTDEGEYVFTALAGTFKAEDVTHVHAFFSDGSVYEIRRGATDAYCIVINDAELELEKFEGLNAAEETVFVSD